MLCYMPCFTCVFVSYMFLDERLLKGRDLVLYISPPQLVYNFIHGWREGRREEEREREKKRGGGEGGK